MKRKFLKEFIRILEKQDGLLHEFIRSLEKQVSLPHELDAGIWNRLVQEVLGWLLYSWILDHLWHFVYNDYIL